MRLDSIDRRLNTLTAITITMWATTIFIVVATLVTILLRT
jgi:hypothetical protein